MCISYIEIFPHTSIYLCFSILLHFLWHLPFLFSLTSLFLLSLFFHHVGCIVMFSLLYSPVGTLLRLRFLDCYLVLFLIGQYHFCFPLLTKSISIILFGILCLYLCACKCVYMPCYFCDYLPGLIFAIYLDSSFISCHVLPLVWCVFFNSL